MCCWSVDEIGHGRRKAGYRQNDFTYGYETSSVVPNAEVTNNWIQLEDIEVIVKQRHLGDIE